VKPSACRRKRETEKRQKEYKDVPAEHDFEKETHTDQGYQACDTQRCGFEISHRTPPSDGLNKVCLTIRASAWGSRQNTLPV
jgi:hypothetical protein